MLPFGLFPLLLGNISFQTHRTTTKTSARTCQFPEFLAMPRGRRNAALLTFSFTSSRLCNQILRLPLFEIDSGKPATALRSEAQIIQNKNKAQAMPIPRLGGGITAKRPKPIVKSHYNARGRGGGRIPREGTRQQGKSSCVICDLWLENKRDPLSTWKRTLNKGDGPQHVIVHCSATRGASYAVV